ncbi:unnamed protein product [Rhizoctonia solani]|uniref:Uncharacterized protein n=1 Tax=Rhizoctonia solani TaxID=456999 RepID=A0A8H3H6E6_9AGAM|nr:unnamed protein product [Rhizoctonia solani]
MSMATSLQSPEAQNIQLDSGRWGILTPCNQRTDKIYLRTPPEPEPLLDLGRKRHTFKIGGGESNDLVLPSKDISEENRIIQWDGYGGGQATTRVPILVRGAIGSNKTTVEAFRADKGNGRIAYTVDPFVGSKENTYQSSIYTLGILLIETLDPIMLCWQIRHYIGTKQDLLE